MNRRAEFLKLLRDNKWNKLHTIDLPNNIIIRATKTITGDFVPAHIKISLSPTFCYAELDLFPISFPAVEEIITAANPWIALLSGE